MVLYYMKCFIHQVYKWTNETSYKSRSITLSSNISTLHTLTSDQHNPWHHKQHDAVQGNTFLQDDDKDLSVHHYSVQQTSPHEQQRA